MITLGFLIAATLTFIAKSSALDVSELLTDAQRSYIRGDTAAAKEKFGLVLKMEPENRTAIIYTRRIAAEEAKETAVKGPPNATKAMLEILTLPKVQLNEASLGDALEFLRQKGNQLGGGKVAINFVLMLDEREKERKFTLSLQNVPFTEVLRYIGDLTNVQFSYDRFATTVRPKTKVVETKEPVSVSTGVKVNGL